MRYIKEAVASNASVVDENVHFSGIGQDFIGRGGHSCAVGDVHGKSQALRPSARISAATFSEFFRRARNNDNIRAFLGEFQGDGAGRCRGRHR